MPDSVSYAFRKGGFGRALRFAILLLAIAFPWGRPLLATTVVPISDAELYRRADVIAHGIVLSSDVTVDDLGRPETITFIEPLSVLKGQLSGSLVLHQVGGTLPDGRFLQLWGRPEYRPGHEVVVFAIARPEGEFQTAEMVLGKFEVQQDEEGRHFAVPALVADAPAGVTVRRRAKDAPGDSLEEIRGTSAPRHLETFLRSLRQTGGESVASVAPRGALRSVVHTEFTEHHRIAPLWGNISGLWRWTNGATAVFTIDGTANITGGGTAEANGSMATWDAEPNSTVNYSIGPGSANLLHVDALSSPCGWSTCLAGGGVIGCGGPNGGATHSWRGDTYGTITGGEVWVRSYCTANLYGSVTTQAVMTHELGHTLGLGHSDQTASPHDVCRGDEDAAQMRAMVQGFTTLGTDDSDALRWLYGDGGNSCSTTSTSPAVTTNPASGVTQAAATLNGSVNPNGMGTTASFQYGTTTSYGYTTTPQSVGSGTGSVSVSQAVSGLMCNKLYHFRIVATSGSGTSLGSDQTFTTGACTPSAFYTLTPCRVVDTRNAAGPLGGPALAAGADRVFSVTGQCGIPATAKALSANVTVTQGTAAGDLRLSAAGAALQLTSSINYRAGVTRANNAAIPLGLGGGFSVHSDQTSGTVQVIIDVNGYFQ